MTLYRNVADQEVFFTLINAATGAGETGATVAVWLTKNSGAQAAGAGSVDELGHGQYRYNFAAADTNAESVGLILLATNCVPVSFAWTTTLPAAPAAPVTPSGTTTPYTEADLTAVRTARLRGIRTVQFADRSTTYTSDAEMRQVEQDIVRELRTITSRKKQTHAVAEKGF